MRLSHATVRLAFAVALLGLAVSAAGAASYKKKSVDGRRYHGTVVSHDYGAFENVEITFHDDLSYVYLPSGGRLVLVLEDEEIADPLHIEAYDPRRGINWEIRVWDLRSQ